MGTIDIPPKVSIPICIEQGVVYLYRLDTVNMDGTSYSGDRVFIVLNANPKTDETLILTTITKQVAKQREFIKKIGENPDTLVSILPSDFPPLKKESVVNCNNVYPITLSDLITKVENNGKIFSDKLPKTVINLLISGIIKSNQISSEIKKMLI